MCNRNRGNGENSENCENSVNRIVCCGVGCLPRVNLLKMVKIMKVVWAAWLCVSTLSRNSEKFENGEISGGGAVPVE